MNAGWSQDAACHRVIVRYSMETGLSALLIHAEQMPLFFLSIIAPISTTSHMHMTQLQMGAREWAPAGWGWGWQGRYLRGRKIP